MPYLHIYNLCLMQKSSALNEHPVHVVVICIADLAGNWDLEVDAQIHADRFK